MPEVLRLQIVYETERAASNLTTLESRSNRASIAALHLAKGISEGNISAVTLARSVEHLGGNIGALATGIGLAAAAFILWKNHVEAQEKLVASLAKEVDLAKRAMDELLGIHTSDTEKQIRALTDRIKELQAELNKPKWYERMLSLFTMGPHVAVGDRFGVAARQTAGAAALAAPDPRQKAIDLLQQQLDVLKRLDEGQRAIATGSAVGGIGGARFHPSGPAGAAFNRPISFHPDAGLPFGGGLQSARGLDLTAHPATPLVDPQVEELTRQQQRIVDSWTAGLETMQGSLEEFLVTGKFVFQQLIDDLLRIAFRAATDQFVDKAVKGVLDVAQKSSGFRKQMSGG